MAIVTDVTTPPKSWKFPRNCSFVVRRWLPVSSFITGTVIRVDGGVPTARHTWTLQPAERTSVYQGFPQYRPPSMLDGDAAPADSAPAPPQATRADPDRPTDRRNARDAGPARGAPKGR